MPATKMPDQTRTMPDPEGRLLERLAKVFALLSDAAYHIADGEVDKAEELLNQLSDAQSFVITSSCLDHRASDTEVARWEVERAKQRAGGE